MDTLTLRRPDDWHLHLRDDEMLRAVVGPTAAVFGRAIVMPNLKPPVTTAARAEAYRARIRAALPDGSDFTPLMTVYLTDNTDPADLAAGHAAGVVTAAKLYPAGATTNSDHGVTDIRRLDPVLAQMAIIGMPLLVHGEVTADHVDIFDREAAFLDEVLAPLLDRHPQLRVVVEHATTAEAVDFVKARRGSGTVPRVGCTITPQHLLANRNDLLVGGIKPHYYCLPVLKRARHQQALLAAATSGHDGFFLGTDSAPHPVGAKESACGCAGCFTAQAALPLYAQAFEHADALGQLEAFASLHGPRFYGLPVAEETVTLERAETVVPAGVAVDGPAAEVRHFMAGETIGWRVATAAGSGG